MKRIHARPLPGGRVGVGEFEFELEFGLVIVTVTVIVIDRLDAWRQSGGMNH